MTAFARRDSSGTWGSLTLEARTVNHRYLEVSWRLPEELRALETELRSRIGDYLRRGKVDCTLRYQAPAADAAGKLVVNHPLVEQLAHASREIDQVLYNPAPISSLDILRWPGVLQAPQVDQEQLADACRTLLDETFGAVNEARAREGEKLRELMLQRCDGIGRIVEAMREHLPAIVQQQRDRLLSRLGELKAELDQGRLEQEMAYLAQKSDVAEEIDRLETHVAEVRRLLDSGEPVGRQLDFLMQELNREANTLASKSTDTTTTGSAVELKVLIEQMREQVQNIE